MASHMPVGSLYPLILLLFTFLSLVQAGPPNVTGIHHLKVPVSNINVSLAWYTRVMGAQRISTLDHINRAGARYAVELQMPSFGVTVMELRLNDAQATSQQMFDPITWGVQGLKDIQAWEQWLNTNNVATSPVFTGVTGWVLVFQASSQYCEGCNGWLIKTLGPG
jgi:hypothetical protein